MDKPITLCDRCDIYMSCLLNYDGPACRRNRTVEPTNADCLRAMTDEELADFMIGVAQRGGKPTNSGLVRWCDWLKQEAKDNE